MGGEIAFRVDLELSCFLGLGEELVSELWGLDTHLQELSLKSHRLLEEHVLQAWVVCQSGDPSLSNQCKSNTQPIDVYLEALHVLLRCILEQAYVFQVISQPLLW